MSINDELSGSLQEDIRTAELILGNSCSTFIFACVTNEGVVKTRYIGSYITALGLLDNAREIIRKELADGTHDINKEDDDEDDG